MQLNLNFVPPDEDGLWQQLDQATRKAVIDGLAQAIAKAIANSNDQNSRETNDE